MKYKPRQYAAASKYVDWQPLIRKLAIAILLIYSALPVPSRARSYLYGSHKAVQGAQANTGYSITGSFAAIRCPEFGGGAPNGE